MENRKGLAKTIADALKGYVTENKIDTIILMVKNHALAAGAAAAAAEIVPGGALVATAVAIGFTWTMYYKICQEIGVPLSKSKLKALASVLVAEVAATLGVLIAGNVLLNLIPGLNVAGAAMGAVVNFAAVYAAGVLFLIMMARVFKAAGSVEAVVSMSEEDLVMTAKETAKKDGKKVAKNAVGEYKSVKDDPNTSGDGIKPMED